MNTQLTPEEIARYRRHLSLKDFGAEAQARLKAARVLVIGAGGLGCPVLMYLAAAGIGHLTVIDGDRVELSNLQRQVLYGVTDLGLPKAQVAARRLSELNPLIEITPIVDRFRHGNALELCGGMDVVVDGSDNFATRYLANDACVLTGKPLVYGAIHQFEGQASVFNWKDGPTYRCLFPEEPDAAAIPNCAEAGVLGVLPGLIGTIQASETIKLLTGIGQPLSGRLLMIDALGMNTRIVRLKATEAGRQITQLSPDVTACCATATRAGTNNPSTQVASADEVTTFQLKELLGTADAPQLIDVREAHELSADGLLAGAVHWPAGLIAKGPMPVTLRPSAPTVVYCAAGVRSLRVLPALRARGFVKVASLKGGLSTWATHSRQ